MFSADFNDGIITNATRVREALIEVDLISASYITYCVFLRFFKDAPIEADVFSAPVYNSLDNTDTVSYPSFRKRGGGAQPGKRGGARPECSSLNRSGEAARALRARQASFPVLCCVCLLAGFLGFAPETAAQSTGNEVTIRVDVPKYVVEGKTDTVTVTMSGTRRPVFVHLDAITLSEDTFGAGFLNDKYVHTVVYPEGTFPIDYRDVDFPGMQYKFAKDSSSVQTFPLEAVDDGTSEPPELAAIRLYIRPGNVWLCAHCTIDSATPADGWSDIWEEGGSGGPDGFYWFIPILEEAPDMVRSEDNMTITEESSDTYTVQLATHPIADVATVTLDVSDPMALTVDTDADTAGDQNTLSFTASNWNERQTVTITAEEDDDAHNHIVSVKHTLAGGIYDNLDVPPLIVTIEDADTAGVTITEPFGATKLSEPDGTDGYDVELNSQPAANVKISVQAKAGVTINKSGETAAASQELTFTSSNWNTAQTITVAAVDDDIDQPHGTRSAMIFHTASSDDDEYDGVSVRDVEAIIRDDDPTEVTLSTPDSTATEGSGSDTAEILLTLNRGLVAGETLKIPLEFLGGAVETDFTLSLKDSPGVSFLPSSTAVTFEKPETGASATSATLTLTALKDADAQDQTVTVSIPSASSGVSPALSVVNLPGGAVGSRTGSGQIVFTDDDTAGVTITDLGEFTTVSEAGGTDMYDVALGSRPAGDVIITVKVKAEFEADVTVNKPGGIAAALQELTFTSSDWNEAQTITVAAKDNAIDQPGSRLAEIFHTASSDDDYYDGLLIDDMRVTIRDDDPTEVTLSTPDSTATEGSGSDMAEIRLTLNRGLVAGETLKIPLAFSGGAVGRDFTLSLKGSPMNVMYASSMVTFEGPDNGASATSATLTLTARKDADAQDKTVTVSIPGASSGVSPALSADKLEGGAVGSRTGSGRIVFTDDDEPVVSFASAASSTSEGSGEHDVTINLDPAPASNISLQYRFDFGGTATEDKDYMWPKGSGKSAPLAVSPEDATLPIPVEIIDDKVTEGDETMLVTILDGSGYIVGDQDTYTLTILDNDKGGVTVKPTSLSLTEGGGAKEYTVVLDTDPGGKVMMAPNAPDKGVVEVSGQLTFDSSNWRTPQTVTVTPLHDADAHDETITIRHIVSGYVGVSQSRDDVTVRVMDDDKAGVTLSTLSLSVQEGGTEEYTVVLDTDPLGEVTVTPTSNDPGVVAVSCGGADPCALTFDSGNYRTPQPVTVTPADDADADNESVTIMHTVSGYAGVPKGPDMAVVVDDDEVPVAAGVDANPLAVELHEGSGMDGTYTLVLRTDPGGAVTVTPSSSDREAATVSCSADPCALTFNSSNWRTAQTVTITPVDDADADNESVTISHAVSGYAGGPTVGPEIIATVDDDEEPVPAGVEARPLAVALQEGSGMSETYTLVLRTDPGVAVTVTPSSDDPGAAAVSCSADPCALTFDSSNWDQAQRVTVTPADDDDTDDESVTITHTVSDYASVPTGPSVRATVEDDDEPAAGVSFASAESRVGEGAESVRVTVNIDPAPSAPISVQYAVAGTATAGDAGDVVIAGSGTVSAASGAASAAILITIDDDDDRESDETVILTLRAGTGYDLGDPPHEHILTILDNDEDNVSGGGGGEPSLITLSVSPNPVPEGETVMVTATLSQPLVRSAAIPLAIAAGTAEAEDYQALRAIEIAANEATGAGAISTAADADLDDETFTVSLGILPEGMAAGAQASVEVVIADATSIVSKESFESENEIPTSFALDQNYPNPFNPVTTIGFSLARAQHVRLVVYDLLGQEVRVLLDGVRAAARHRVSFDASDLASGTYLYVLRTEEETAVRTMALLK